MTIENGGGIDLDILIKEVEKVRTISSAGIENVITKENFPLLVGLGDENLERFRLVAERVATDSRVNVVSSDDLQIVTMLVNMGAPQTLEAHPAFQRISLGDRPHFLEIAGLNNKSPHLPKVDGFGPLKV